MKVEKNELIKLRTKRKNKRKRIKQTIKKGMKKKDERKPYPNFLFTRFLLFFWKNQ
jgi:hypothetical protein